MKVRERRKARWEKFWHLHEELAVAAAERGDHTTEAWHEQQADWFWKQTLGQS